jgi:TolB-like protein/tetratricopeptide (TPR) repeat protein
VLIVAWLFELNQRGLVRDAGVASSPDLQGDDRRLIGSQTELGIIVVMLVVVAGLFYAQWQIDVAPSVIMSPAAVLSAGSAETIAGQSIAVLPFESFSDDSRDRFFADGLSEELLNVLARVNGLQVAARTSSFAYRGVKKTVQQIGRELQVNVILEGSVRRNDVDDTIRVTAQLIDTTTGAHLWTQTYDRQFTDVFKIQDEISAAVVSELKITLLSNEQLSMLSHASASPEAMITYSMGQAELARRSETAMRDAERLFQRAVELDPNYVAGWVGLADTYSLQASYRYGDSSALLVAAQEAVDRALGLDPLSGLAWASQGLIYSANDELDLARNALRKAIELSPSYAMAHMWYGSVLEDNAAKLVEYETAYRLDPRSPVVGFNVANLYISYGREAEAMRVFAVIIEADPNYALAYNLAAKVSRNRGRLSDAIRQYEQSYEIQAHPKVAYELASLQLSLGNYAAADEWISLGQPMTPDDEQVMYDWLDVQRHVMQDDIAGAREILRSIAHPVQGDEVSELMAAYAAYLAGDYPQAIQQWDKIKGTATAQHQPKKDLVEDVMLGVAFAYQQQGEPAAATKLLAQVETSLAKQVSDANPTDAFVWYRYAMLHAMNGRPQLSLRSLQRAIDEGWFYSWQPQIEPALQNLRQQPDMVTMLAGLQTRLNLSREQYAFDKAFAATSSPGQPDS